MRIARLDRNDTARWALLDGDRARLFDGSPWDGRAPETASAPWSQSELLAPVMPSKIICIGRNYAAHAKELGNDVPAEPLMFFKPPSAVIGPAGVVHLPKESTRVEHEAELVVVIGRRVRRVTREAAMDAVFGYTCACDVTARDLQKKDGQWSRAKGFDTFCPVGPWIETELDPRNLSVRCIVGGEIRQDGRTSNMIFDVPTLVSYASQAFTLEPGDVVLTGTPEGVGPLEPGKELTVSIEGIGDLTVSVASS